MKHYKKENCTTKVREVYKDPFGKVFMLIGKHSYEWSITVESENNVTIQIFPNRIEAKKEFNNIKRRK